MEWKKIRVVLDFMFSSLGKILETLQQARGKILLVCEGLWTGYFVKSPSAFLETPLLMVECTVLLRVTACSAID